jgi:hypothetical protein
MEDLKVLATALNEATKKGAFNLDEATAISQSINNLVKQLQDCEKLTPSDSDSEKN